MGSQLGFIIANIFYAMYKIINEECRMMLSLITIHVLSKVKMHKKQKGLKDMKTLIMQKSKLIISFTYLTYSLHWIDYLENLNTFTYLGAYFHSSCQ